jgi:hypothetical protein
MRLPKTGLPVLALVAASVLGSTAPASADSTACRTVPGSTPLSEAALRDKAAALGYDVWRIELDDGCYEVEARDSSGAYVELDLDPATGDLLGWERED